MSINASYAEKPPTAAETVRRDTLRDLFAYYDWARDQVLTEASKLSDAQLDRPFEIGLGSLRATLHHLWAAERIWLDRWHLTPRPTFVEPEPGLPISDLWMRFRATAAERSEWLLLKRDPALHAEIAYVNMKGEQFANQLGDMMLHVCNHGAHHRAQALNMFRHLGVKPPWMDYLALAKSQPAGTTPTRLQMRTLREYLSYGDWATRRMLASAAELTDEELDRPFEMGLGTVRKTMLHIRFAEQWWLQNWTEGPNQPFPELPDSTSIAELRSMSGLTAQNRNTFLDSRSDADLLQPVVAKPRPELTVSFSLGATVLQICHHGTHHRAQALNMLRRLGKALPGLDLILWVREGKPA